MTHNVRSYQEGDDLLTISDYEDDVAVIWKGMRSLELQPHESSVVIEGEDLFALREFLTELPEEAFVRPADPIPDWTQGDAIVGESSRNGQSMSYVKNPDNTWSAHGRMADSHWRGTDAQIEDLLAGRVANPEWGYRAIRRGGKLEV